ncbi:PepSY-associated TM helix domain-containing protein [Tenacibaculum ovolyticum]|uniref:PepSY-associated TM helix domain-containing protein n=1 Tax=Tenacibaculum ovolyticum TaxID=104270 RepID=UPI0022F3CA28|nr:PepSY-associated TM helix domain-containing protein [Tenacibaculum ovolyticum]WBX76847.1 PepSY-associated TM helix domain-containing protein [Tenacibaculum ovolyticum]
MSKKNYNIFFNTHTVSGIVISVALYIIFFAGAFSLFKQEIQFWEEGKSISHTERKDINYDKILSSLDEKHELTGRDLRITFEEKSDRIFINMTASKDTLATEKGKTANYFYADINSTKTKSYIEQYSLGEFLFRLHFFQQFPVIGVYLAGLVSFFFLFAIVTGVIVHWKKIIPKFYAFNPKTVLQKVWTNAHTALGIIGLPFQFIFAVTGAYFALSVLVLLPANFLYNGNQTKLLEDLRPARKSYEWVATSNEKIPSFNSFVKKTQNEWDNFHVTKANIKNYGGVNMKYVITGELEDHKRFVGLGRMVYDVYSNKVAAIKDPYTLNYNEDTQRLLTRLHFGDYGGTFMKIIYLILSLITCFVIITGVLIWIESRNKKSMTLRQRLYTAKVGHIYLSICLSMLPVTALAFLFVKFANGYFINKQTIIYYFYFITWLLFILYFRFKRDNYYTNKASLLLGAIFGFLIPISNGVVSGNWIWTTYLNQQYEILFIDLLWIGIASFSLLFYIKTKPTIKNQSAFSKAPIDYKNLTALKENLNNNVSKINNTKNTIPMRTKISLLWIFIAIGFIFHHIYGLATVFFNESVLIEGSTGETPFWAHQWRILMEGLALTFGLLTLEVSKKWFILTSFVWAIILGLFNVYHIITAVIYEASNISEILILLLLVIANVFLIKNINIWRKETA